MNDPMWHDKQLRPCPEWEDMLASEDMLSTAERDALASHIEQCPGCRQTQLRYRALDRLARRFFAAGEPLPGKAPLLPEKPIATSPPATEILSLHWPRNLPHLRRGPRVAWGLPAQIIGALPSLAISSVTGLLIFAFSQISITFWHMPPAQALPLAAIGTAVILWPILGHLQFKSTVQSEFGLAGNFLPPIGQDATFHVADHTERQPPGKQSATINLPAFTYASQDAAPGWQIQAAPLTRPRRRRIPVPHMAVLLLLAIGIALFAVARLNPPPSSIVSDTSQFKDLSIDGNRIFDLNRQDANLKLQAARDIAAGNTDAAKQALQHALLIDSSDAEALIYLEDLNILALQRPYVTIVVITTTDQGVVGERRDMLQGAYLIQKEVNHNALLANGVQLRVLIAAVGFDNASAQGVAQQIVHLAKKDHTIVGVMGFPTSASTLVALPILTQAHIPIVSAVASSDKLANQSPYFFRVVPSDARQAVVGARYAKQTLHARHVVLFEDPNDAYSSSLADAFRQNFVDGEHSVTIINYTREQPETVLHGAQQIQNLHPDLVYFSGYVNDATVLLQNLPACGTSNCLQVMGGDALYVQGDYSLADYNNYSRLIFTAFASPDTWRIQGLPEPAFFNEYATTFDPHQQYQPGTYGYNLSDADAMLAYDAMQVLVRAVSLAQTQGRGITDITPTTIQQSLTRITGNQSVQGVSGKISFNDGEVSGKPVLVLQGGLNGQTSIDSIEYP